MATNYYRNLYYNQVENNQILSKDYMNLQQENNQLKEKIKYHECFINHLKRDKIDLQQRIDKIIEYINSNDFVYDELYIKREKINDILGDKENE